MQSFAVEFSVDEHSGPIRRSIKRDLIGQTAFNGCLTLFETFQYSVNKFGTRPCLGERSCSTLRPNDMKVDGRFIFKSYQIIGETVHAFSSGLEKLQCLDCSESNRFLGIYMKNCKEWIIAENACYARSTATIPLYDTLGKSVLEFIINQTGLVTVLCSWNEIEKIIAVQSLCSTLKHVIVVKSLGRKLPVHPILTFHGFEDVVRIGQAFPISPSPPKPSTLCTLCYTSGTTGQPKGAMITHGNMVAICSSGIQAAIRVVSTDVYLSFLPLAHIFERIVVNGLLASGAAIGFFSGDILQLGDDLIALRPSIFCAVPRLLTRLQDKIETSLKSMGSVGSFIFNRLHLAMQKPCYCSDSLSTIESIQDQWLWGPMRKKLGLDNVRVLVAGGAPLPLMTRYFFQVLLGPTVSCLEGYGQTESTGATTLIMPRDNRDKKDSRPSSWSHEVHNDEYHHENGSLNDTGGFVGSVGPPLPNCDVKLVDVPDMGYSHRDSLHLGKIPCMGRGEIYVKGPGIFQGYFKNSQATNDSFDSDGWLKTGDVGMWTLSGEMVIIDRVKNLCKLSQGEYVALEKVENVLGKADFVSQIFVHGESTENCVVAIIVPDCEKILSWIKTSLPEIDSSNLSCSNLPWALIESEVKFELNKQLERASHEAGLMGFEKVRRFFLETVRQWGPENDFLTPTLKLKRNIARDVYRDEIKTMYEDLRNNNTESRNLMARL